MSAASRRIAGPNRVRRRPGMRVAEPELRDVVRGEHRELLRHVVAEDGAHDVDVVAQLGQRPRPAQEDQRAAAADAEDPKRPVGRRPAQTCAPASTSCTAPATRVDAVIAELGVDRERQARRSELVGDRKLAALHAVRGAGHPRLAVHRDRVVDAGRDPALVQLGGEPVAVGVEQHEEVPGVLGPRLDPLEANVGAASRSS